MIVQNGLAFYSVTWRLYISKSAASQTLFNILIRPTVKAVGGPIIHIGRASLLLHRSLRTRRGFKYAQNQHETRLSYCKSNSPQQQDPTSPPFQM